MTVPFLFNGLMMVCLIIRDDDGFGIIFEFVEFPCVSSLSVVNASEGVP